MDEKTRLEARELLLKSRIYRFIALIFAGIGLVVFVVIYLRHVDGDAAAALRDPSLVAVVLIPFLPAFVLARMAAGAEKKFMKLLELLDVSAKSDAKDSDGKKPVK